METITGGLALICGVFLATVGTAAEAQSPAFGVGNRFEPGSVLTY